MNAFLLILIFFVTGLQGRATLIDSPIEQEFISETIDVSGGAQRRKLEVSFRLKSPHGTLFSDHSQSEPQGKILYQGKSYPVNIEACHWDERSQSTVIRLSLPETWDVSEAYSIQLDVLHTDKKLARESYLLQEGSNSIDLGHGSVSYDYDFNKQYEEMDLVLKVSSGILPIAISFSHTLKDGKVTWSDSDTLSVRSYDWRNPEKGTELKACFYHEEESSRSMHLLYLEGPFQERRVTLQVPARDGRERDKATRASSTSSEARLELVARTINLHHGGFPLSLQNGMEGYNRLYRVSAPAQGGAVLRSLTLSAPAVDDIWLDQRVDIQSNELYIEIPENFTYTDFLPSSDHRLRFKGVYSEQPLVAITLPCPDQDGELETESGLIHYTSKPELSPHASLPFFPYHYAFSILDGSMQYGFRVLDKKGNYLKTISVSSSTGSRVIGTNLYITKGFSIGVHAPVAKVEFFTLPLPHKEWSVEIPFQLPD